MAYTLEITKVSVSDGAGHSKNLTVNVIVKEDDVEIYNKDFSANKTPSDTVGNLQTRLVAQIQEDIDDYFANQTILNSGAADTLITNITSNITLP